MKKNTVKKMGMVNVWQRTTKVCRRRSTPIFSGAQWMLEELSILNLGTRCTLETYRFLPEFWVLDRAPPEVPAGLCPIRAFPFILISRVSRVVMMGLSRVPSPRKGTREPTGWDDVCYGLGNRASPETLREGKLHAYGIFLLGQNA